MKLTLVTLAVLLGVAASSPLTDKVDSLLANILAAIDKREAESAPASGSGNGATETAGESKGPAIGSGSGGLAPKKDEDEDKSDEGKGPGSGASGSGGPPPKKGSAEEEEEEMEDGLDKGQKKSNRKMRQFNEFCKFNLTRKNSYRPVTLDEVGRVFVRVNNVFTTLAAKFESHKKVLEKIEEMEDDDESTENHEELMNAFAKMPDQRMMMQVICALGSIKIAIARAKFVGISNRDFPEVQNCHRTCGQMIGMLRPLRKKQMPAVNVTALQDNVEADYRCMKNHVMGFKNFLNMSMGAYAKSGKTPKAGDVFTMISVMEHIIETLGIRGMQLHACSNLLHKFATPPKPEPTGAAPAPERDLRALLSELRGY